MKKMIIGALPAILLIASSAMAQTEEPSQSACFFMDRECLGKERIYKRREARQREEAEQMEKARQSSILRETERREKAEEQQRQSDLRYQQYLEERANRQATAEAEEAAEEKRERIAQKKRDAQISDQKARCGDDYKTPRIGMTVDRIRDCVAPVKLTSQINRADGVASVYVYGSLWANVMGGKVIAWGK